MGFSDGEKAVEKFKQDPYQFDLIITDMTMPNMTGAHLSLKIKDIRPDVPIILCTGFSDQINEIKAQAMGIEAFMLKPMSKQMLSNKIRQLLDHN